MLSPFGSSAVIASFQGTLTHSGPVPTITTKTSYGVSVNGTGVAGVFICVLPTGTTDNNVLVLTNQFGAATPFEVDVLYATLTDSLVPPDGTNQRIVLAFKTGSVATDPPGLVNFVFYACSNVIDTTP